MILLLVVLRPIYYLLYHQFAWTYDFVAGVVSLGHWNDWVKAVLPHLEGRVLEIGYGPGHLQTALFQDNIFSIGLDESPQMALLARLRLQKSGFIHRLSRGYAQSIPFASGSFDTVVATFPSEYIFDPETLKEIRNVLTPGGKLVVVPTAWITGKHPLEKLVAWLFMVIGAQGAPGPVSSAFRVRLSNAGFYVQSQILGMDGSQVLVISAIKH
jgi:ubiquinone/menaquinone biosynthesis C-methylase UbiE